MGQKVSPNGLRIGVVKGWNAQWYADKKTFSKYLVEDHKIRTFLKKKYYQCSIAKIDIERKISSSQNQDEYSIIVTMYSSKLGMLLGKDNANRDVIKNEVLKLANTKNVEVVFKDVKKAEVNAQLVAENIAAQLEKRIQFRRAMKSCISYAMKGGALGIKTMVSGRLDGAEIARSESYHEGSIPLQTLRADIDYATAEADTTFGKIGVKVWIYNGDKIGKFSTVEKEGGKN